MSITKPILIVSIYLAASSSYSASFPQAFEKLNDKEVAFACIVAIDRSITEVENSKVDKITFKDKQLQIYKVLKSKMLWKQWIEHNGSASWYEKRKLKTVIKNFSLDELTPPVSYCISHANSIMRDMGKEDMLQISKKAYEEFKQRYPDWEDSKKEIAPKDQKSETN